MKYKVLPNAITGLFDISIYDSDGYDGEIGWTTVRSSARRIVRELNSQAEEIESLRQRIAQLETLLAQSEGEPTTADTFNEDVWTVSLPPFAEDTQPIPDNVAKEWHGGDA